MSKLSNFEHVVKSEEVNERLDKLLVTLSKDHSRHQIQSWIKDGYVKVNEKQVKSNYRCKSKDIITWTIEEEKALTIEAENIPLSIVYEDDSLIILNKPKGMLVHPTLVTQSGTLVNALKYYTEKLSTIGGEERPGIVHRLDQHTSGIMVICKDNDTHKHVKEQFKQKTVTRVYEAIVHGVVEHETGIIKAPIGRNPNNRTKMAVVPDGKDAETRFQIVGRSNEYTHVQCQLVSGRMHQIRVHMKYMKHPIVGDPVYSRKKIANIESQALYAKTIGFIHPKTETYVEFSLDPPKEFVNLLEKYDINY